MLATARAALLAAGITDPSTHAIVYRSAWNVRILLSPAPFDATRIAAARAWCDARSFDVSYYPGMDVAAARAGIYNDLPAVSFESAEVTSDTGLHDAVADEAGPVLAGLAPASAHSFDLSPITLDRPSLNAVLRLAHLDTILQRLEVLPQSEVGPLVNLAVLVQACVIALLVLAVPLVAGAALRRNADLARATLFFPALGLGFLMIEIAAIEAASLLLTDRTLAFSLVLTSMLICSGIAHARRPRRPGRHAAPGRCRRHSLVCADSGDPARRLIPALSLVLPRACAWCCSPWHPSRWPSACLPPRPRAPWQWWGGTLGLGAERRLLCGSHATRQPDCN